MNTCLECGLTLKGRIDKKFCGDMCRNSYNNKTSGIRSPLVRNTNRKLIRNRKILSSLLTSSVIKVNRRKLQEKGFHFGYCTSTYTTQKGEVYYFCYEYGFIELKSGDYCLVKKQETASLE